MADKTSVLKGGKSLQVKVRNVARTMTTGTQIATLPRGSRILGFMINGVASDAATTAVLSFGSTTTANEYVSAQDVKTAAAGVGPTLLAAVSGVLAAAQNPPSQSDLPIFAKYAETGTASTVGSWKVAIMYTVGNVDNDDTI
jgi:hypothetical protein